jgi:hypothetical protein
MTPHFDDEHCLLSMCKRSSHLAIEMQNKFLTKSMAMKITRNNGSQRKDLTSGSIVHLYSYLQNDTTVQVNELIHGCLGHGQMLRIDRRILRRPTVFSGSAFTAGKPDIYIEGVGCPNLCLLRSSPTLLSSMSSIQNKVQNVLRFADEHHQRIFRVSYIVRSDSDQLSNLKQLSLFCLRYSSSFPMQT